MWIICVNLSYSSTQLTQWAKSLKKQSVGVYLSAELTITHSFKLFLVILPIGIAQLAE